MQSSYKRRLQVLSCGCALWLTSGIALADTHYELDIRGAPLNSALKAFAEQTGLQVAYFTRLADGRRAAAVAGSLTAEQALTALLRETGLTFERIDAETIAIRELHKSGNTDWMLTEVLVTGTHIRGVSNETAPVRTFDRQYIERSGYSNMMQLIESLPMNFKGGASGSSEVAPFGLAPHVAQNLTRGSGVNLRGLGSVSTLTLINGRRVAPSAQGQFVDVSKIPLTAVERVEILTDGASAIYGADAVAGVVNIILRQDFQGAETTLRYGSTSDNAMSEYRVGQTFGRRWSSGNALLIGEFYKRGELDVADREYIIEAGAAGPTYLLPRRKVGSILLNLQQQLPARFDLSGNMLYADEAVRSAFSESGDAFISTQSPDSRQWSAALSLGYAAFADWRVSLDTLVGRVETTTDFTSIHGETGEVFVQIKDYHDQYDTGSAEIKADGSLLSLPGGALRLALGTSYRVDDVRSTRIRVLPATGFEVRADDSRHVTSAFAELYVPIIGSVQGISWAKRLELSLAARYDDYSDFGRSTNPRIGLLWSPVASLDLRAGFSKSFRAPTIAEKALVTRDQQISTDIVDAPDGSGGGAPIFYLAGSAPLLAEKSDNLSFGLTFRPPAVDGASISLNFFSVDYTDRISSPPFDLGMLSQRQRFGHLITDLADDAAAQAFLDSRIAAGDLWLDWAGTGSSGVRHVFDFRQQNAARTRLSGFDFSTTYAFTRGANGFSLNLDVARLNKFLTSLTRTTTTFEQVDTYNQPLDWRARGLGTWTRSGFSTSFAVSYADDYINDSLTEDVPITAWTTVDVTMTYDFSKSARLSWLSDSRLSVGINNLFDRDPPFANSPFFPVGYDVFNADAVGRFVSGQFSKRW